MKTQEAPRNIKTFIIEDKKNPENAVTSKMLNMVETVKDISMIRFTACTNRLCPEEVGAPTNHW